MSFVTLDVRIHAAAGVTWNYKHTVTVLATEVRM